MISVRQIKAARALLGYSLNDLEEACSVNANTISRIENGSTNLTEKTARRLEMFFRAQGLEFLDHEGIRFKPREIVTYHGHEGFVLFVRDVFETVKDGGEICVSNVDESNFLKWEGEEADAHMARMATIKTLKMRILVERGDQEQPASGYAEYRSVPTEKFGGLSLYIFGPKTALIIFKPDNVEVYVIDHPDITSFFRAEFMRQWHDAE